MQLPMPLPGLTPTAAGLFNFVWKAIDRDTLLKAILRHLITKVSSFKIRAFHANAEQVLRLAIDPAIDVGDLYSRDCRCDYRQNNQLKR